VVLEVVDMVSKLLCVLHGTWYLVLGAWYMVSGKVTGWYMVHGIWHLVLSTW
jgi:hypothetical protein